MKRKSVLSGLLVTPLLLQDFLFPIFNTLSLLGLYDPGFQLLLAKHQV